MAELPDELRLERDAAADAAKQLAQSKKERSFLIWRVAVVVFALLLAAGLIYYVLKGLVLGYHKIFGRSTAPTQQIVPAGGALNNGTAGNGAVGNIEPSQAQPSAPVISNFNIVPLPPVPLPPASALSPQQAQINNPGCPDYLGDVVACVQSPPPSS